jgi:LemA protein
MVRKNRLGVVVIALLVLGGLYTLMSYNSLVGKDEKVKQMWSEVQTVYQRRLDLTQNLVNVVKGVSDFEQGTLTAIAEARSRTLRSSGGALTAENYATQVRAQDDLGAASNRLIAVIEKYPTLKGTDAYRGLQTQLEGNERRIKVARNDFNASVADYNKSVRTFPKNLVAGIFGFKEKTGFQAIPGSEKSVEIKF